MTPDQLLDALDPEQAEAARAVRGPVCILAGAGTGKTRTVTHRAAYAVASGAVAPSALLAVTFTARAAGEMRTRLRGLGVGGVQARTFHAAAMKQLGYFWPKVVGGRPPTLLTNKFGLVANAAARARLRPGTSEIRDLLAELEWAACTLVGPDDYPAAVAAAGRTPPYDAAVVAQVYEAYRALKQAQDVADFDDLLLLTAGVLEEHADVAEEFRSRYRSFVVDEYQDVTPLQQRLLDAWLGGRDDVCVVGDVNQTIYSFTGATPDFLVGFRQRFPARDRGPAGPRLPLDAAGRRAGQRRDRQGHRPGYARLELRAQRPAGPAPALAEHPDEPAEAAAVAARCAELMRAGHAAERDRGALPGQRPVRGVRGGAGRRRGALPRPRRRAVLRPGRGARGDAAAARRRARRRHRRPRRPRRRRRGRAARRPVLAARGAARRRRGHPRAVGVARRAAPPGGRPRRGRPRRRPARAGRRAGGAGQRPARAHRRRRDARVAARRQGPRVGRRLPRRAGRRHAAAGARRHARAGRGGAPAALRRRHPRARAPVAVVGARPLARAAGRAVGRRASWTGCWARPPAPRAARAAAGPARGRPPPAGSAARAWSPRSTASSAAARAARPTATRRSTTPCATGGPAARRTSASRRTACSPTRPWPRSPSSGPGRSPRSSRSPGSARPSSTSSARTSSVWSRRPRPDEVSEKGLPPVGGDL